MKPKTTSLLIYFMVSATQLVAQVIDWPNVLIVSKVLIVPSLLALYFAAANLRAPVVIIALLFCWAGDIALIFQGADNLYFMAGLGAFLAGHVLYIFAYRSHRTPTTDGALMIPQQIRFSLPIVLAGTGLVVVLYPHLGGLRLPVMVYALAIMLMVMNALFRFGRTGSMSFWLVFTGAITFMASDSILAINKFLSPVSNGGFWIMLTYMGAQLMIVTGLAKHPSGVDS